MELECGVGDGESSAERGPPPPPPQGGGAYFAPSGGVLASLCEVPKFLTLRIPGTIHGQRVLVLVDSGATHNFIDAQLAQRRGITTIEFKGYSILVSDDRTMQCTRYVPTLTVTMGN